jgi:hypothetical protein
MLLHYTRGKARVDKKPLIVKWLVVGIILLFICSSIPALAYSNQYGQFNDVSTSYEKNCNPNPLTDGWMRIYFGHEVEGEGHALQTSDGGFLLMGHREDDDAIILIKTNSGGITEWKKAIGENKNYKPSTIKHISNNSYIIVGSDSQSILLIKINSMGDILWEKTIETDPRFESGYDIIETSSGDFLIVGEIRWNWLNSINLVVKTDSEGNLLWVKTIGSKGSHFKSVAEVSVGGYIITGTMLANNISYVWLIRTTVDGEVIWDKRYTRNGMGNGISVQQTSDNGFIIGAESIDIINHKLWVLKTDNQGNMIWNKTYGVIRGTYISSVKPTSDNGFIICGYINQRLFMTDGLLIKTDGEGNKEWSRTYGGLGVDALFSVEQTTDGGYILGGHSCHGLRLDIHCYNGDLWLVKTDENGRVWSLR